MKKIGLLGGTFNPIHNGHLALAQTALEGLKLDKVIFVPAKVPVHKESRALISAAKRLKMVELAVKGYKTFEVSDVEIRREGKSYSIDTAIHFRNVFPTGKMYFIIGSDSYSQLHTWRKIEELDHLLTFACVNRAGVKPKGNHKNCLFLEMPALDISSSHIRKRISKKLPVGYMLSEAVNSYIQENKIYL